MQGLESFSQQPTGSRVMGPILVPFIHAFELLSTNSFLADVVFNSAVALGVIAMKMSLFHQI